MTGLLNEALEECAAQAPDPADVWAEIQERIDRPPTGHRLTFAVAGAAAAVVGIVAVLVALVPGGRADRTEPGGRPSPSRSVSLSATHPSVAKKPPPSLPRLVAAPPAGSAAVALHLVPDGWHMLGVDPTVNAAYYGPPGANAGDKVNTISLTSSRVDAAGPGGPAEQVTVGSMHGWVSRPGTDGPTWAVTLLGPPAGRGNTLDVDITVPAQASHDQVVRLVKSIYSPGCPADHVGCHVP